MPLENLPNGFAAPTRNEVRDRFQRDVTLRQPGAPVGEGSQAFVDGSVIADAMMPLFSNAVSIARGADLADMTRDQLKAEAKALSLPEELPAGAGEGYVTIAAATGGVYISTDRELKDETRNLTFHCISARTYFNGQNVPVICNTTGPNTNVPAGTKLKWRNPPPGLNAISTVLADSDGNGFTGGRVAESDDDIRNRISTERADPSAAGNVATVRRRVKEAGVALGIAIQEVFVYPAITGSGHYAYIFTLRPGDPGSSRIPSSTQIAAVRAHMHKTMPEDDGIFSAEVLEEEVAVKLGVTWATSTVGWVDPAPWPPVDEEWSVLTVTNANAFDVSTASPGVTPPQAGQTIAFYNRATGTFARKRILTATSGMGYYTIVVDTSFDVSDTNYLPEVGEEFCPYALSLDVLVKPFLDRVDLIGPGEQIDAPFDEGYRQRRHPLNPAEWPSTLRYKALDDVDELPQVHDVTILSPSIPYAPAVGVPSASSNMIAVTSILAFPL